MSSTEEPTGSDFALASLLRKKRRRHVPLLLILTKCDNTEKIDGILPSFHELSIAEEIIPTSAIHGLGISELEEAIAKHLRRLRFEPASNHQREATRLSRIAIIGRPNVGKSSIVNALMSEAQRRISPRLVSDIPSTTRDTTDTVVRCDGKEYLLLDTAGLKRNARTKEGIETYAMLRAVQAVEGADVSVLVLDASSPVSHQDKRIAALALEAGTGLVLAVNKMDLLRGEKRTEKLGEIRRSLSFCRYAPILPCSAHTRENLPKLFSAIDAAHRNRLRRVPTPELHRWLENTLPGQPMGSLSTSKHITQAEDPPPTFVLFVRDPKSVRVSQLRFLERRLRETFGFEGTPVRWVTKKSGRGYPTEPK